MNPVNHNWKPCERIPKGMFYSIPGTFQSSLPPRFSNLDYGSLIRYDMPPQEMMAIPRSGRIYTPMYSSNYVAPTELRNQNLYHYPAPYKYGCNNPRMCQK